MTRGRPAGDRAQASAGGAHPHRTRRGIRFYRFRRNGPLASGQ
jgi:hypothetical protein